MTAFETTHFFPVHCNAHMFQTLVLFLKTTHLSQSFNVTQDAFLYKQYVTALAQNPTTPAHSSVGLTNTTLRRLGGLNSCSSGLADS